jgi:chromosome segregation ATPase
MIGIFVRERESETCNSAGTIGVMSALPREAEKLLAVDPGEFVAKRNELAAELREAGRGEDAAVVAGLSKPTAVVFAVNRAARNRPNAARDAADAAERVRKAQLDGDPDAYATALEELKRSLDLLSEVADTHVGSGKRPTEAMRRRVRDLVRSAVADDDARDALRRGALTEEIEASGFSPFAGTAPKPARAKAVARKADRREEQRRERERELRDELESAEAELRQAESAAREAERERARAERKVASLRKKLEA